MRYQTLDLRVTRRGDDAFVVHAEWAHGRGSDVFVLEQGLERDLARLAAGRVDRAFLKALGRRLFDSLLRSGDQEALEQLNQCWGAAKREPGRGMRIRLRFDEPSLAALPWEFLYWPSRDCFVGTSVQTGLVRFLEVPDTPPDPEVRLPVGVLVVSPATPDLDSGTEVANLTSVLDDLAGVEYRVLDGVVTRERIRDALREAEVHVLHFIGHGGVDEAGPFLLLNRPGGPVGEPAVPVPDTRPADEALDDEQFAGLVENHPTLELITLNSCRGALQLPGGPFVGMAQRLVARGVPAVVAMQLGIYDKVALDFARELYRSLFTGSSRGDVEVAVARARKALETDFPDTPALGTPVLFLNREHGVLFDLVEGRFLKDVPTSVERAQVLRGVEEIRERRVERLERAAASSPGEPPSDGPLAPRSAPRGELEAELGAEREALRRVRRRLRAGVTLALLPAAVAVLVFVGSWLYVLDGFSRWARLETVTVRLAELGGPVGVHDDVAVVAVDSLDVAEEDEPWGRAWRPRIGALVDRISEAGASVIALDLTFAEASDGDEALAEAIRRAEERGTAVIVGVAALEGGDPVRAPALRFARWGTLCAATGAQQAVDLVVVKSGTAEGARTLPSLPLRAVAAHRGLRVAGLDPDARRVLLLDERDRPSSVRFAALERIRRATGGCPLLEAGDSVASLVVDYSRRGALRDARRRMSWSAVVRADAPPARLRGKLVVVGSEPGDLVVSLYPGLGGERRYGFEIMADAASTLLFGRFVRPLPAWASFLSVLALAFAGAAIASWPREARRGTRPAALAGVVFLLLGGAVWAYRTAGLMILVAYPALALVLGFWGMGTVRRWRFT